MSAKEHPEKDWRSKLPTSCTEKTCLLCHALCSAEQTHKLSKRREKATQWSKVLKLARSNLLQKTRRIPVCQVGLEVQTSWNGSLPANLVADSTEHRSKDNSGDGWEKGREADRESIWTGDKSSRWRKNPPPLGSIHLDSTFGFKKQFPKLLKRAWLREGVDYCLLYYIMPR